MSDAPEIRWIKIKPSDLEGKGWENTAYPFSRLPKSAEKKLPEQLIRFSRSSTGMNFFFNSDSTRYHVRWTLAEQQTGEDNFNVSAYSGLDLYTFDEKDQAWRWFSAVSHGQVKYPDSETCLIANVPKKMRQFRMYLPFRNKLEKLEVGIEKRAKFDLVPPRPLSESLVWYGTSIVHGALSIRSGLGITQIMGRRLGIPTVNLGFSGSARLEKEMAEVLAELSPRAFVVDPVHNIDLALTKANAEPFLRILCSARPDVPVIVLGAPPVLQAYYKPLLMKEHQGKTACLAAVVRLLKKEFPLIKYIDGTHFYGTDREVSMDGVHPNDLAFQRMADYLEPRFRKILGIAKLVS